jgi:hypothetical protein
LLLLRLHLYTLHRRQFMLRHRCITTAEAAITINPAMVVGIVSLGIYSTR